MAVLADGCCFDDFLFAIGAFFYFYFFRFHFLFLLFKSDPGFACQRWGMDAPDIAISRASSPRIDAITRQMYATRKPPCTDLKFPTAISCFSLSPAGLIYHASDFLSRYISQTFHFAPCPLQSKHLNRSSRSHTS